MTLEQKREYLRRWRKAHPNYSRDWTRRWRGGVHFPNGIKGTVRILGIVVVPDLKRVDKFERL